MNDAVSLTYDDDVATLTLERPDVRNALTQAVSEGIIAAVEDLEGSDARCLVVRGEGGNFCAGGDINMMLRGQTEDVSPAEKERLISEYTHRSILRIAQVPIPTVAAVDGAAFGAGGSLTLACDVALASESARIGFGFRQVGLAVDSGVSALLPRVVGMHVAKELVYTGEVLDADRARELGLFNHVYPDEAFDEEVDDFVATVAEGPTVALRTSKRLLDRNLGRSLEEALEIEAAAQMGPLETDDHAEGTEAFMSGRDPEFEGE